MNFSGILMNYILDRELNKTNKKPLLMIKYVVDVLAVVKKGDVDP